MRKSDDLHKSSQKKATTKMNARIQNAELWVFSEQWSMPSKLLKMLRLVTLAIIVTSAQLGLAMK